MKHYCTVERRTLNPRICSNHPPAPVYHGRSHHFARMSLCPSSSPEWHSMSCTLSRAHADKGNAMSSPILCTEQSTQVTMFRDSTQVNGHIDSLSDNPERYLPGGTKWIVQKFGGTSLGKFAATIAEDIVLYVTAGSCRARHKLIATGQALRNTRSQLSVRQEAPRARVRAQLIVSCAPPTTSLWPARASISTSSKVCA